MSRRRRPGRAEGTLLAGWLFADLLLALSVIFLGVVPGPTTTTTTSSTTTTLPVAANGLTEKPVCLGQIDLRAETDLQAQRAWIRAQLDRVGATGRRVGFLLVTGGGESGIRDATTFAESLHDPTGSPIAAEFGATPRWSFDPTYNPQRTAGRISIRAFFFDQEGAANLNFDGPGCGPNDNGQMP